MAKEETNDSNLIIFEGKKVTPKKKYIDIFKYNY
jgi:hypothetical protein